MDPQATKPWNQRLEEAVQRLLHASLTVGTLFSAPWLFFGALGAKVFVYVMGLLGIDFGSEDPFRLRRYGDTLLSEAVKKDLHGYAVLLGLSLSFELFAWGSMWSSIGDTELTGAWGILLSIALALMPFIFARMIVLLDHGILVMDDPGGRHRAAIISMRASLLFMFALITAVPVELRAFAPEIDRVHEAAEKAQVDAIREKAKAYETKLAEEHKDTSAAFVTGQPDEIVARRRDERAEIVKQQKADRADISRRLDGKSDDVAREIGKGSRSGRRGDGAVATGLRRQESAIRGELSDFDKESRKQLVEFDAETERMRSEAAQKGVDELSRRDSSLEEKLHEVEVMPPDELAAAYGGDYKVPNGFMARYRTLLDLVGQDWKNRAIAWGCRLLMVGMGIATLFIKFVKTSPDTKAYYSFRSQAIAGNEEAIRVYIVRAKDGDADALHVLRMVVGFNLEAAEALKSLGYDGNPEVAAHATEVRELHARRATASMELGRALVVFRSAFGDLCLRRPASLLPVGMHRSELVREAQRLWQRDVQPRISALEEVERNFRFQGVAVPRWSNEFGEADPRSASSTRLWNLSDDQLEREFGWINPDRLQAVAEA